MYIPDHCERCLKKTNCLIMSMYDTKMICFDCKKEEEKRPDYKEAVKADLEAIKNGNYNFKGIGLK